MQENRHGHGTACENVVTSVLESSKPYDIMIVCRFKYVWPHAKRAFGAYVSIPDQFRKKKKLAPFHIWGIQVFPYSV